MSVYIRLPICLSIGQLVSWWSEDHLPLWLSLFIFGVAPLYLAVSSLVCLSLCIPQLLWFLLACVDVVLSTLPPLGVCFFIHVCPRISVSCGAVYMFYSLCVWAICLPVEGGRRTCSHNSFSVLSSIFNVVYLLFPCVCLVLSSSCLVSYSAINSIRHSPWDCSRGEGKFSRSWGPSSLNLCLALLFSTPDSAHVGKNLVAFPLKPQLW